MRTFYELEKEARRMLDEAGINYNKKYKAYLVNYPDGKKSLHGICYHQGNRIEIAKDLMETEERFVINVLVHEYIHTCDGCQNHSKNGFLSVAKIFNDMWEGYNGLLPITAKASPIECNAMSEIRIKKNNYKYVVKCPECGMEWYYTKNCKIVKTKAKDYHCGACKCEHLVVEEL